MRPHAGRLAAAGAALVLSGAVSLALPGVAGLLVDAAVLERSLARLGGLVPFLLGLFALSAVLDFMESYLIASAGARMLMELRSRLHGHLLTLGPSFHDSQRVGDLLSRLGSDVDAVENTLTRQLVNGLREGLVLLGSLCILLSVHPRLTAVMLLAVPPVVVAAVVFALRLEKLSRLEREALAQASVASEEALSGIRTVQAFSREDLERERYRSRLSRVLALGLQAARTWGAFGAVVWFVATSALTLVLWYGAALVVRADLTPGALTSFLFYTMYIAGAVGSLTGLWGGLKAAAGATERLREILDQRPAIADAPGALGLTRARGQVAFREVSFSYPGGDGRRAIDGVRMELEPGEAVALVGPSGGGKSTLVGLLLRFHDPDQGQVLVDGVDVRRYRLRDLREAIGLVPQEVFLLGGTVAENIRYGRPEAADEDVRSAAEAAQAHQFIVALPQGYRTVLGERGVKLSAGQRQRIAIARVFLKDPAIVVLDEATSALDSESELLVQKAFDRLLEGRTTLVIAHRMATARRAGRVVLLDRGAVVEEGPHAELMARDGLYKRLCDLQSLGASR